MSDTNGMSQAQSRRVRPHYLRLAGRGFHRPIAGAGAFALPVLLVLFVLASLAAPVQAAEPVQRYVRGIVEARIALPPGALERATTQLRRRDIALPHARVFLFPARDLNKPVGSALSDLSGRFLIKTEHPGPFTLCVEAEGFQGFCGKAFKRTGPVTNLQSVFIAPATDPRSEFLAYGKVTLQDGELARGFEPVMDVNAFATVRLESQAGTKYRGFVNNFGDYVVPRIPAKADFRLAIAADELEQSRDVKAVTGLLPGRSYRMDFVLPNAAPRLRVLSVMAGGKPVQVARPGSKVELNAVSEDRDGDKLVYRWLLPDGKVVGPTGDPKLTWDVPGRRGEYPIRVLISDRRGGYEKSGIVVTASTAGATFSGTVVDSFGQPINGAQVEVNGRVVNTNIAGWFSFAVPVRDRYVMNIRSLGLQQPNQRGFGTASHIYKAPIAGGRWALRRAQVTTVDPTQPIVLQQRRDKRDCIGPRTSQIDWQPYLGPGIFQWQDGRGTARALVDLGEEDTKSVQSVMQLLARVDPRLSQVLGESTQTKMRIPREGRDLPCRQGIKVEIPANALVDTGTGQAPTGPVQLALSSVSLTTSGQMPGDYSARDGNGTQLAMESFGAGSVAIGAGNARYNLKEGEAATVTIPVDATQVAGGALLQPTIPFLYYDEREGVWIQEGEATLIGSGANAVYQKKVTHFSSMNADILKSGQSCLAVEVDPAAGFTLPLDVEVVMQPSVVNPDVTQVRTLTVDSTTSNVIYNLPNESDIVLTPIIQGVLPDGSTGDVPAGVFVVNTGGPQTAAVTPPPPNPDGTYYAEDGDGNPTGPCASRVTLTLLSPVTVSAGFQFLQGLYLQSSNIDEFSGAIADEILAGAQDYYDQADPRDLRNSFNLFLAKNDFGEPLDAGEAEFEAQFANSGDLGFGRDMHCRRNNAGDGGSDYACYVTNYGQPPADNPDQQDANATVDPAATPDATVAMEFSRVENPPDVAPEFPDDDRAVKFFVYNTNAPDDPPLLNADLDGNGTRPIPQLCMICHGGTSASIPADPGNPAGPKKGAFELRADIMNMRANFLPFDLPSSTFPASKGQAVQEDDFKNLNEQIVRPVAQATGTGDAIVDLVDLMYDNGASPTQLDTEVLPAWDAGNPTSNRHRFYRDVFARTCRTCHVSEPFGAPSFDEAAAFEAQITNVQNRVCNQKVMPHAQRTSELFWTSLDPSMPGLLELYGQTLPGWSSLPDAQCGGFYQSGGIATSVFAGEIYPILFNNCTACHSATGLANFAVGNVADTYNGADGILTALAKDGSSHYIVPNDPAGSLLYERITTGGVGVRMPQNGANLAVEDTDSPPDGVADATEILSWINAGAPGP